VVRFDVPGIVSSSVDGSSYFVPWGAWSARSAWPNHPAIFPPLPQLAKSSPEPVSSPIAAASVANRQRVATIPSRPRRAPASSRARTVSARPQQRSASRAAAHTVARAEPESLAWPSSFDDWMIDIVRRRAIRLNSGARRRGVRGSVRAVDLAHILEHSKNKDGHWTCALCHGPVTLEDLSFDHVTALADGGEHAAHNLVPAHRKCNEIKGSEKAQVRAQALDRWISEWAATARSTTSDQGKMATQQARRYA